VAAALAPQKVFAVAGMAAVMGFGALIV